MFHLFLISLGAILILVSAQNDVTKVTTLLLPQDCDLVVSDADKFNHQNFSVNKNIQINKLFKTINETIISVVPKDDCEIFVLTDKNVLKVNGSQVIDQVTSEKVTSSSAPIFALKTISNQEFLVKCAQNFCQFFNPNNLSDFSTFDLETAPDIDSFVYDSAPYNYVPIGQWFKESSGKIASCRFILQKYCSARAGEVLMFNSLAEYHNIIYHFQFNKSSFVVEYGNNGIIIVIEIVEDGHDSSERKSNYRCGKPVAIYFDWTVSKLYVVVESPTGNDVVDNASVLSVGWIDPFNNAIGNRPLLELVPLPFDKFSEFVIIGERKIFNLGFELIAMEGNETRSMVKMSQKINLDKSVINPGLIRGNKINFHTSSELFEITQTSDSGSDSEEKPSNLPTLTIVLASVTGLIGILIVLIGIVLIRRKNQKLIISRKDDHAHVESPRSRKEPDAKPTIALPPGLMRQPIFIFEESLSDIYVIAKGAFGNVCKGVYDGRPVAIKSLFRFNAEKLKQEADIACSLDHPNVLPLIGICFDASNQQLKLVLPFMVNGDLASYLDKVYLGNVFSDKNGDKVEVTGSLLHSFASQIVAGMAYLVSEDQGHPSIIHRDLAARNCMVDADMTIKVADFGLSRHLDESKQKIKRTLQTSMIPSTSAPESITRLLFNERTDVWSYGSLLLEFYDGDLENVPEKVLDLSTVCHSLDPDDRPTFTQIQLMVSQMSDDEFEPVKDAVAPLSLSSGYGNVSVLSDNVSDEKLMDMIQQAPTPLISEGANEFPNAMRKESLDQEPFDDIKSALARNFNQKVVSLGKFNGYVNPGIVSSSGIELQNYTNYKLSDYEINDDGYDRLQVEIEERASPEKAPEASKDNKNGYFNLGSSN